MNLSSYAEGPYKTGYDCDGCDEFKQGERWHCKLCLDYGGYDYCFDCFPKTGNYPKISPIYSLYYKISLISSRIPSEILFFCNDLMQSPKKIARSLR